MELADFNIKPILFEIGFIRTPLLATSTHEDPKIEDYKTIWDNGVQGVVEALADNQPGDVDKLAEGIIDVVKRPNRKSMIVPMGKDTLETLRTYADSLKAACDEFEDVANSVERDEPRRGGFAQMSQYWLL
jgi:hypothetical protein